MLKEIIKIGNKSYIKAKVVMLPTNEKATFNHYQLCIDTEGYYKDKLVNIHQPNLKRVKPQHLYITSDEEIKRDFKGFAIVTVKDDTRIQYLVEVIVTEQNQCYCKEDRKFTFDYYSVKPIIATTDKLSTEPYQGHFEGIDCTNYLPQPSQSFIEKYIEEYNKGNIITDIMVEYEKDGIDDYGNLNEHIKIDKNNYITITKVKDTWNKDEVIDLCRKSHLHGEQGALKLHDETFKDWINENL